MFISNAYAEAAAPVQGGGIGDALPLIFLLAFGAYLIYTQFKRGKEQRAMLDALQRGDEVVTVGGEIGRISKIYEGYVGIELAENFEVTVQKNAIQSVLPKGTIKSIK